VSLPGEALRQLAQQSLLAHFAELCGGTIIVDTAARIVWMSEHYADYLGVPDAAAALGRPVEEIIPNSQMRQVIETGQPIMLDLMDFGKGSFVVTRLPLRDAGGQVVGAVGFMLYDDPRHLAPLFSRYQQLRADLAEAERRLAEARRTKYTFSSFIGLSKRSADLKLAARRAARTASSLLILGETGTGKELLAQAIHAASPRAGGRFVAVNIAAIPESLLEAEFFGVAPGAYTGAERKGREGKLRLADGGTLFLDEIGEMSLALQAKLLRALQEREFEPVGSNRLEVVDVRIIAATSRNLEQMVADGSFRADLYYRLNVITLHTPPLRERAEDLPLLAEYLVDSICRQQGMPLHNISPTAIDRLRRHDWPGNVRELANVLERALLMSDGDLIDAPDIETVMPPFKAAPERVAGEAERGMAAVVAEAERKAILDALAHCRGNKAQAARLLGISRAALYEKIAALGVSSHAG